jgi:hypothetical protein
MRRFPSSPLVGFESEESAPHPNSPATDGTHTDHLAAALRSIAPTLRLRPFERKPGMARSRFRLAADSRACHVPTEGRRGSSPIATLRLVRARATLPTAARVRPVPVPANQLQLTLK